MKACCTITILFLWNCFLSHGQYVGFRPSYVAEDFPPITNKPVTESSIQFSSTEDNEPVLEVGPDEDAMSATQKKRYAQIAEQVCDKYKALNTKKLVAIPLLPTAQGVEVDVSDCTPINIPLIIGGQSATIQEFPHMALVGWKKIQDSGYDWKCGGSLISDQYVLTAGHCTYQERDYNVISGPPNAVQLGSSIRDDPKALVVKLSTVIRHPKYKRRRSYYDVALLKMVSKVRFSDVIKPACLGVPPAEGERVVATGWGRTEFGSDQSAELRSVSIKIWNEQECKDIWGTSLKLPNGPTADSHVCAGERKGGKDTCQGDSGSPAQIQDGCIWRVVAITSVGRSCGAPKTPALYAQIHIPFIAAQVFGNQPIQNSNHQQTNKNNQNNQHTNINNQNNKHTNQNNQNNKHTNENNYNQHINQNNNNQHTNQNNYNNQHTNQNNYNHHSSSSDYYNDQESNSNYHSNQQTNHNNNPHLNNNIAFVDNQNDYYNQDRITQHNQDSYNQYSTQNYNQDSYNNHDQYSTPNYNNQYNNHDTNNQDEQHYRHQERRDNSHRTGENTFNNNRQIDRVFNNGNENFEKFVTEAPVYNHKIEYSTQGTYNDQKYDNRDKSDNTYKIQKTHESYVTQAPDYNYYNNQKSDYSNQKSQNNPSHNQRNNNQNYYETYVTQAPIYSHDYKSQETDYNRQNYDNNQRVVSRKYYSDDFLIANWN